MLVLAKITLDVTVNQDSPSVTMLLFFFQANDDQ